MKLVNVKPNTYIVSSKEINEKDPKFKIGDIATITKCKNIFVKGFVPNWSEEVFKIKKNTNNVFRINFISDLKLKKLLKRFTKKNWKKYARKSLEFKKQ